MADNSNQDNNLVKVSQGQIIQSALNNLTENQRQDLMAAAAAEALKLEVEHRQRTARHDSAQEAIHDHVGTFSSLDKNGKTTRHTVTSQIETGSGSIRIESKSGAGCFVATAAFESAEHPTVTKLRYFRDNFLNSYSAGRSFIRVYYVLGPYLGMIVSKSSILRSCSRSILNEVVKILERRK
jgi:hypothetical protein